MFKIVFKISLYILQCSKFSPLEMISKTISKSFFTPKLLVQLCDLVDPLVKI